MDNIFETLFWIMFSISVAWIVLSILIEYVTYLNDGDEEFFEGTWVDKKFGKVSIFGYPLKHLTGRDKAKKILILPYLILHIEEDYLRAWVNSLIVLVILSLLIPAILSFVIHNAYFTFFFFFGVSLHLIAKKKIREAKKRGGSK